MTQDVVAYQTVLVVDDSEGTRIVLRRLLEARDYRVVEAADGREAVEVARRGGGRERLPPQAVRHGGGRASPAKLPAGVVSYTASPLKSRYPPRHA